MQRMFYQYDLTTELAKKYSHSTYLASPTNEPESQVVLNIFATSLFRFPHERENLLQKAQCITKLQYQHLVPILDMGIEEEQPFVVREYLPNGSLRSYLKKLSPDRLELREALAIILQIGLALAYAHDHHVLHGNIKPENILFDADGQAVLADFSLMSRRDVIIRNQTMEEYAFCYLAPEQFSGTCDARSDQYALGCLTYELITGQAPFAAQSLASMMGHQSITQPAPLSESVADLPSTLERAVLKTLAHDPNERFFDCSQFLEVIRSILFPLPAFPLGRSINSYKNRIISHPVQSTQAESVSSPIRECTIPIISAPQPSELSDASFSAEAKSEGLTTEWAMTALSPKGDTHDMLLINSSPEGDDILFSDIFMGTDTSHIKAQANSIFEQYEFATDEASSLSLDTMKKYVPLTRQTWYGKRSFLALVFLLLAVAALVTYVIAFPPWMAIEPNPNAYLTDGFIPQGKSILPTPLPMQATIMATAHVKSILPVQTPSSKPASVLTDTPTTYKTPASISTQTTASKPAPISTQTITPEPAPISVPVPTDTPITYEAESSQNTLAGGAQVVSCAGSDCSGGVRVEQIGRGGTLQCSNVNKSNAGNYALTIYYTNGSGNRVLYMSVNRGSAITVNFSATGSWHTVGTLSITVSLNAGNNTIMFSNSSARGPDIDKIVV